MNAWMIAATALLVGMVPCGVVAVRAAVMDRLVAVELAGTLCALVLMLMAEGSGQSSYLDLALGFAVLSYPAGMVFAKVIEKWM